MCCFDKQQKTNSDIAGLLEEKKTNMNIFIYCSVSPIIVQRTPTRPKIMPNIYSLGNQKRLGASLFGTVPKRESTSVLLPGKFLIMHLF